MYKYKLRLTFSLLSVILVVLIAVGILLAQLFKGFYFEHLSDRMAKEARLVAITVAEIGLDHFDLDKTVANIGEQLEVRVTVTLDDGTVIAETDANPLTMENHLLRPEIQEAIKKNEGRAVRYSDTVDADLLYYAVKIQTDSGVGGYVRLGITIAELKEVHRTIFWVIAAIFSIAFIILTTVSSRITNEMTKPIEEATVVANQLADGNYRARTTEGKQDETGNLSKSLNVLAKNLEAITKTHQAQQERLETLIENMGSGLILINTKGDITLMNRSCKEIFQENTDEWLHQIYYKVINHKEIVKFIQDLFLTEKPQRKNIVLPMQFGIRHFDVHGAPIISSGVEEELKGVVLVFHDITELKKLEQMRKDFVANVSHELKTPVTSVKGFTETLLDGAAEDHELRNKFLKIIWSESERLQSLIQDLLDLSKIEQSQFRLSLKKTSIIEITDDVLFMLGAKAEEKELSLTKQVEGNGIVNGDPLRLKQIIINLVNNAIMYTPQGGKIEVLIKDDRNNTIFTVKDTGIGISQQELPRIFERFYRVDRARSRNSGGTGLGLAIVKHLVEAHKGEMQVESKVGVGTTFTIIFKKN